jgi:two-component system sensor histidine kinase BaeS
LLDVSRIDSGHLRLHPGPVDAAAIARAAAQAAGSGHPVRIDAAPDLPLVLADADRLEDVLANLTGNAAKFSPPGAPIHLSLTAGCDTVAIAVRDRGQGIAADEIPRIFDRFYQVQRGADRRAGGSGLGLYIARAYVEAMGGAIRAESASGEGSTFTVTLPAAPIPPAPAREDEPYAATGAGRAAGG